jgi:hypothetical protein
VILLVLVALLWIIVLAPGALRRFGERKGGGSIDHFHHQLRLLEHAGPKMVTPAYRLRGPRPIHTSGSSPSRPKLVLLRPVDDGQSADIDDGDGAHYARVGVIESPQPPISPAQTEAGLAAYRRQQARQRCTLALRLLTAAAIATGIMGVVPSLRMAWIFTALTALAALSLVGLISYARELEGQRQSRPRTYMAPRGQGESFIGADEIGAAQAGHPGAWDDEGDEADAPLRHVAAGR